MSRGLLALGAGLWLAGCVDAEVVNGINPVVGCTSDADCETGYFCEQGGCQAALRTCSGTGDTADCYSTESCCANPGCQNLGPGQECPAAYVCLSGSTCPGAAPLPDAGCTSLHCSDANTFFSNYCNICHIPNWTCSSPATQPLILSDLSANPPIMPPVNAPSYPTAAQNAAIVQWIQCGAPQ